jgi:ubiquinone/menaquinone biosynthesis C-methylase UbiE
VAALSPRSDRVELPTSDEEARIRGAYARRGDVSRYSLFNPGQLYMVQERQRRTLALLAREGFAPLADRRILEVGCGLGNWLRDFVDWGAAPRNLAGIDLLPDRVAAARALCPPAVTLLAGSAAQLPFADDAFDIVLQATVFTSILDASFRRRAAAELLRVVRPGGIVLWYDFHAHNPRNADVRGVTRAEIAALFPACDITLERITLAPPLSRALAPVARPLCTILGRIPLLCTHHLGAIRKRGPYLAGAR